MLLAYLVRFRAELLIERTKNTAPKPSIVSPE